MSKVILFNMATLDGFFAGSQGEIDWHHVDEEFNEFAIDQLNSANGLIFGRKTYELMASYWPTQMALEDDPLVAGKMNSIPKIVVSSTLEKPEWENTRLVKQNIVEEIHTLKQQSGKDWLIFGSADLATELIRNELIDEFRVMINPIVLGRGMRLFKDLDVAINLKLMNARTFRNGNVLLSYQPDHIAQRGWVAESAVTIQAPPSKVWEALTNPEIVKQIMFGADVVTDWKEGSPILYKGLWQGKPFEDKGWVVKVVPERLLITTHWSPLSGVPDAPENYHMVGYRLTPHEGGTRLVLTQDNNASKEEKTHSENNWNMMLATLKRLVEQSF